MSQRIFLFSGKGGVGKSWLAAAFAHHLSFELGKRTLLVEFGESSRLKWFFGKELGQSPTPVAKRFDVACWSGERTLREYVKHLVKLERLVDIFFQNHLMSVFIKAAPALKELALLGKVTSGIRKVGPPLDYDCLVVDSYSTGHHLALLQAPSGMMESMSYGPIVTESESMIQTIKDPLITQHLVCAIPESLPVVEAIQLSRALSSGFSVKSHMILNKLQEDILRENKELWRYDLFKTHAEQKIADEMEAHSLISEESFSSIQRVRLVPDLILQNHDQGLFDQLSALSSQFAKSILETPC